MKGSQDQVAIAVGAIRDLEALLRKASRRTRLSARQRVQLRGCADQLKEELKASNSKIRRSRRYWLSMLRCLSWLMRQRTLKQVVESLMGGNN